MSVHNSDVAAIFAEVADLPEILPEIEGEDHFRVRSGCSSKALVSEEDFAGAKLSEAGG